MSEQWMTHQAGKFKKNTIFQDTIFDLYTQPQPTARTGLVHTALRARCNKTCQRNAKFGGKGWYLTTSGKVQYKVQETVRKYQPFHGFSQKFLFYKSFPSVSCLGAQEKWFILITHFFHLCNEDQDTGLCYTIAGTIH